jgi:hypothetical protein
MRILNTGGVVMRTRRGEKSLQVREYEWMLSGLWGRGEKEKEKKKKKS